MNKITIKKTALLLLISGTIFLNKSGVNASNTADFNKGDYVKTKTDVSVSLDIQSDSKDIGLIKQDEIIYRVLSFNDNLDLIKYKNTYGFVNHDFLEELDTFKSQEIHYKNMDIIRTNSKVNFRLEPNLDGKRIDSVPKGELVNVIAKTENNWYLITYNGAIGYVCGDYVTSIKDEVRSLYPNYYVGDLSLANVIYATSTVNIRTGTNINEFKLGTLSRYESALVLGEYDGWYLILTRDNTYGFVNKDYTKKIDTTYVVIDLSEQHLWLYDEDSLLLETDIVTGSPDTPTNIGLFKIYRKQENRYLTGEDYHVHVDYWMPFDGGIGLHDASWRRKFGGSIYLKDGSHGCVNMPSDKASDLYENVEVGTKVLVHK